MIYSDTLLKVETPATSTVIIPTYGPPIFPTAIQILPLDPHFSEDEITESSPGTDEESDNAADKSSSEVEDTAKQDSLDGTVTAHPDVINTECTVKLDQLNEDEINAWTNKEMVPEFPDFIQGREVGGYTMRLQTKPTHQIYNPHLKRSRPELSYENLDETEDGTTKTDNKKPKKHSKPVPKDGLSAERMAAHKFYL